MIARNQGISGGEPILQGTRISVAHIVTLHQMCESPEAIQSGLPHLTLRQIREALAFYEDNRAEIDGILEEERLSREGLHTVEKFDAR